MNLKKIELKKAKLLKIFSRKAFEMTQRIDKLENLLDLQEQYSWHNCLLVHGIEKKL